MEQGKERVVDKVEGPTLEGHVEGPIHEVVGPTLEEQVEGLMRQLEEERFRSGALEKKVEELEKAASQPGS